MEGVIAQQTAGYVVHSASSEAQSKAPVYGLYPPIVLIILASSIPLNVCLCNFSFSIWIFLFMSRSNLLFSHEEQRMFNMLLDSVKVHPST